MKRLLPGITIAAGTILSLFSGQAQATPTCTTFITATSGFAIAGSSVITLATGMSNGTCVDAGDKIFGNFNVSGAINGTGSVVFTFDSTSPNVTIGFQGAVGPSMIGTLDYEVEINNSLANGFLIHDLEKDFTLNSVDGTSLATATLTATSPVFLTCTRTVNPSGGSPACPIGAIFSPLVSDIVVDETLITGANARVTALTDTISQARPTPEPGMLGIIGAAMVGLCTLRRRRRVK
jgi:hypothetical protein